jgi:tripartite-type tricarboxylate transporter receptor subunit TctC
MFDRELSFLRPGRREVLKGGGSFLTLIAAPRLARASGRAAGYPERPVRIVVPFAPGGPTDIMARMVSTPLGEVLGKSAFIENKPGAGGNIGIATAARSDPDGYTLLLTSSAYVLNPALYDQVPYDPFKDFVPIAELGTSPNVVLAHPSLGVGSIQDLIAMAKAQPDRLNYSSPGVGTTPHLAAELLKLRTGIKMAHVPYAGAGPAIQAILSGTVQVSVTALPPAHPHVQSGALRGLAVTGRQRWFDLPNVPTLVELGWPEMVSDTFQALLAPANTPREIVDRLAKESTAIVNRPEIRQRLQQAGFEVIGKGPDSLRERIAEEVPKWKAVSAETGIKAN